MKTWYKYYIGTLLSILFLLTEIVGFKYDYSIQLILFGIGLIFLGIPHGAGDMIIARETANKKNIPFSNLNFLLGYLGSMLVYGIIWYLSAPLGLGIFILISIFHFGELEDMQSQNFLDKLPVKLLLGSLVLGIIILGHWEESKNIIIEMGLLNLDLIPPNFINYFILGSSLLLLGLAYFNKNNLLTNTILTLIIGLQLPLILAFSLYFIACHSLNSIQKVQYFTKLSYKQLFLKLFPFTLSTFILFILYLFFYDGSKLLIANIFIFISIITFPHFFIMHKMLSQIESSKNLG